MAAEETENSRNPLHTAQRFFERGHHRLLEKKLLGALKYFQLAAELGHAGAQYELGYMYEKPIVVQQNILEAIKWYQFAAAQGNADAQNRLGYLHQKGLGVQRDYHEALKWYQLAAAQGHAGAQTNLGYLYQMGLGVEQDFLEAIKWYRFAIAQKHSDAQFYFGMLFYNGWGVQQDYREAIKWLRLSAAQGHLGGEIRLEKFYSRDDIPLHENAAFEARQDFQKYDIHQALAYLKRLAFQKNPLMRRARYHLELAVGTTASLHYHFHFFPDACFEELKKDHEIKQENYDEQITHLFLHHLNKLSPDNQMELAKSIYGIYGRIDANHQNIIRSQLINFLLTVPREPDLSRYATAQFILSSLYKITDADDIRAAYHFDLCIEADEEHEWTAFGSHQTILSAEETIAYEMIMANNIQACAEFIHHQPDLFCNVLLRLISISTEKHFYAWLQQVFEHREKLSEENIYEAGFRLAEFALQETLTDYETLDSTKEKHHKKLRIIHIRELVEDIPKNHPRFNEAQRLLQECRTRFPRLTADLNKDRGTALFNLTLWSLPPVADDKGKQEEETSLLRLSRDG